MPHQTFESSMIKPRYAKGHISAFGINSIYPRTPWVAAWWSAAFPGFGHMFLGRYLQGFVLIIWELVVNNFSNLNLGIALSMLGRFEEAKEVIKEEWIVLYMAVFVYSIWDSYRSAVEMAKTHILSEVEDAPVTPSEVSFFDVVTLDKKNPWVGLTWSALSPGLGQFYGGSTIVGSFVLAWWIYVTYKAEAIRIFFYSFIGDYQSVAGTESWQWFLFIPSMYAFAIYQAYASVLENNTLYDIEQIRFLRVREASMTPPIPIEDSAQIIATFDHSPFVEMVVHEIHKLGVPPQNIVALPLENLESETHILDSIHRVDGRSILDGAMMVATIGMLLGTIYGFILDWGPVIWGLICLIVGFFIGLVIELVYHKHKLKVLAKRKSEVIIQITFPSIKQNQVINLLKVRQASGMVILPRRLVGVNDESK